jgi:uncharacterized protein
MSIPMRKLHLILAAAVVTVATNVFAAETGIAARKPIIAGACPGCVWGPLAEVVKAAMKPYGYDVLICYNCNQDKAPIYVSEAGVPHDLTAHEIELNDPPPPKGPVDFGIVEVMMFNWAYNGEALYKGRPMRNLRLIAKIEDPVYLIIAARKDRGITDLNALRTQKKPIRILTDGGPWLEPVFEYYGITRKDVESWGGRFHFAMAVKKNEDFDLIVSSLGSIGNNYESNVWTQMSEKYDLHYFPIPHDLRQSLVKYWSGTLVDLPVQYLRGVDRPIPTVGRSGHVVYGRADMPADFAYTVAKAVHEHRDLLKWSNRPYSYDSRTVWRYGNVPLHPGAERFYREMGYLNGR